LTRDNLNIAVIGAGAMGSFHAGTLSSTVRGATVTVVCDTDPARANAIADEIGARVETDPLAAINAEDVDAVLLASPGDVHEPQVMACLKRQIPVLCEKPLTIDAESSYRIVQAEAALGRQLVQVGFMRRFDDEYIRLREIIEREELGAALLLHLAHRNKDAPEWFTPAMAITESVVHEVDCIRFLLGEEIDSVSVFQTVPTTRTDSRVPDPMAVMFQTASGRLADVEIFIRTGVGYEVRTELVAENGFVQIGRDSSALVTGPTNRRSTTISPSFIERFGRAYERELQSWVRAAANGTVGGATAWDGYAAQAVCEAGVAALETRSVTRVELGDRPDAA
jgi:myo-inositol 2-dehydrogenase / D-chiro-inositol 1-dehydrogenase